MLIGILSDTHGRVQSTKDSLDLLRHHGATFYLHCGDIGSLETVDLLAGLPAAMVWGNCDWDRFTLQRYAERLNIGFHGPYGDLTLDGKRIALLHGDDARLKQRLLAEQLHDYLVQGHTHVACQELIGRTRVINPGALHRANPKTVALLDTMADTVRFLVVAG